MNKVSVTYSLLFLLNIGLLYSQNENSFIRSGNKLYKEGKFNEAEINYRKSLEKNPQNAKALFNLGDALYKQGKVQEADSLFRIAGGQIQDKEFLSKIYHNIGNSLLSQQKYEESIHAYKNALRNNPNDEDTKYNLAYALSKLRQQQQQQNQNNQNQNNKDKQDNKNQQNQNEQNKDQNKKDEKQQQQPKQQMSKKDAERMLQALNKKEQDIHDKLKKERVQMSTVVIEKDW